MEKRRRFEQQIKEMGRTGQIIYDVGTCHEEAD